MLNKGITIEKRGDNVYCVDCGAIITDQRRVSFWWKLLHVYLFCKWKKLMGNQLIAIPKNRYSIIKGRKFFFTSNDLGIQCAYCLYKQETKFVRDKNGLIIGVDIEVEAHSSGCYQEKVNEQ